MTKKNNQFEIDYNQKVLEVKNLRQYFKVGSGKNKILVRAVDGVSFDIYKREVFGLVGESGSGKTTTGRSIIKLYNPTDGEVIYNGNVVAAGYEGFIYDIKKARITAKHEIRSYRPYQKALYETKQKRAFELIDNKQKQSELKAEFLSDKMAILEPKTTYIQTLADLKERYNYDVSDAIHDHNLRKSTILSAGAIPILKERTAHIKFAKKRYQDKVNFIKTLDVEKYEQDEQIRQAKDALMLDEEYINNRIQARLQTIGVDTNLTYKEIKREYLTKEKTEKREKLIAEKNRHQDVLVSLESKYEADRANVNHSFNEEELKSKVSERLVKYNEEKTVLNDEKKAIKNKYRELIKKLKVDYKENPNKYQDNEAEILKIKEELAKTVSELKEKIYIAKINNNYKELPEEKALRLEKLSNAKTNYKESVKSLKARKESLGNEKFKIELKELKTTYKTEVLEIQKTKPNYVNHLSTMQMIFQDPVSSLNPRMVVSEIISEGLRIRGIKSEKYIRERVYELLNLVGLTKDHATRYPHEFSGGQRQRIGIARALIANPDLIIADEPISALDVSIQAQVINLLNDLKEKLGLTILFIAHDLSVVKYFSDRIAVMYNGKIVELGDSKEIFSNPVHPYTKSLLTAIPQADPISEQDRQRVGYNPMIHDYSVDKPSMREIRKGHIVYANDKEFAEYKKALKA